MDLLTHVFLPLAILYAIKPYHFQTPFHFTIGLLGIVPDFDKLINQPGLFHSLLFTLPASILLIALGGATGKRRHAVLGAVILHTHLVLDIFDGGIVPPLYPLVRQGIGLEYPMQLAVGQGPLGFAILDPLPLIRIATTDPSKSLYYPLNGFGVLSFLTFTTIYIGINHKERLQNEP